MLEFRIFALDPSEKTRCENAQSLMYMMRGFTELWTKPSVDEKNCKISDRNLTATVTAIDPPEPELPATADDLGRAFIIAMEGQYGELESRREKVASFLKAQEFELLYVLKDEVSEQIACKLYPHLYRVENLLRGYLVRFMATHIGSKWWELTASSEMSEKARIRRKNEKVFGKHIENSAYLIDFDELGEIVYEQSSGLLTREAIVHRLTNCPETPDDIKRLKQDIQSNYQKLFKESFADKGFKDKWKLFEALRNKIAHNNLFTASDLADGERLAEELTAIIAEADQEAEKLVISNEEREAIKEQVSARSATIPTLTEEEFLRTLASIEEEFVRRQMFVGFTYFLNNILVPKGYSYFSARDMVGKLEREGRIEVYQVKHPSDASRSTAAIRRAC